MSAKNPNTQLFVNRALVVFPTLFLILFVLIGLFLVLGLKTGELENRVFTPLKVAGASFKKMLQEAPSAVNKSSSVNLETNQTTSSPNLNFEVKSSANVEINLNGQNSQKSKPANQPSVYSEIKWVYPTFGYPNYQQNKEAFDQWWTKVQQQNQSLSEQSRKALEEFRWQSQQNLEQFKLEGQKGMAEFEAKMKEAQQKFLQEHGINP